MSYPTLEQYTEALQYPDKALIDPVLKSGTLKTTGLGLPLALCGGFALTYIVTSGGKKYAVRCFHKKSSNLEKRYGAISTKINSLSSNYFVDFTFQSQGVRIAGSTYPVVKMAWASGDTLATFVEANYRNKTAIGNLIEALQKLGSFLERHSIAHGDIQPENLMISSQGGALQLIDYDGMYVPEIASLGSAEIGQRNFQHPKRNEKFWNDQLDRFSFISLYCALKTLQSDPSYWNKTQSDQSAILFRANDYANPASSSIFKELSSKYSEVKNFAQICSADITKVPSLSDFIAGKNIPASQIVYVSTSAATKQAYLSAYPVVDALNFYAVASHVGDVIEMIGQIVEVKEDRSKRGAPYVFINFGPWQGQIAKVNIWSEGLSVLKAPPNSSWIGQWISVIGLVDPVFKKRTRTWSYEHITITVTQQGQLKQLSPTEAKFRLNSKAQTGSSSNKTILSRMQGESAPSNHPAVSRSQNSAVLQQMRQAASSKSVPRSTRTPITSHSGRGSYSPPKSSSSSPCFIATAAYGDHLHPNVVALRQFRDRCLSVSAFGRLLIKIYYLGGPKMASWVLRYPRLRIYVRRHLDVFVLYLEKHGIVDR
jgi:serine/threonine protein kinase